MHREPGLHDLTNPVTIPNHKADLTTTVRLYDYIGHSWKYPEATHDKKAALWQDHLLYMESFFYFLSQDAKVPASLREEVNQWGLPKDEFADTDTGRTSSTFVKGAG